MRNKGSFTLFEIIISIILISIIYYFAMSTLPVFKKQEGTNNSLLNLKEKLLSYEYENDIVIKCIEDDYSCFVFLDDVMQEKRLKGLFSETPTIYEYNDKLNKIDFLDLELEQLQRYDIVFEYGCRKNKKCDEYIVETDERIYIFNDFYTKPKTLEYISDVNDFFEEYINEVKDAF